MRGAGQAPTSFPTEQEWLQDVNLLTSAGSSGKAAFVTVKIWVTASPAQIDAWHQFALASFLLGATGSQYLEFSSANSPAGVLSDSPWDHVAIGNPTGPFTVTNGVYSRFFTNGLVVVNPLPSGATVTLGGTYKDLTGNAVSSITLGPDAAEVLTLS